MLYRIDQIHQRIRQVKFENTYRVNNDTFAAELEVHQNTIKRGLAVLREVFRAPQQYEPRIRSHRYTRPFELHAPIFLKSWQVLSVLVAMRVASYSRTFPLGRDLVGAFRQIGPALAGAASFGPEMLDSVLSTAELIASEAVGRGGEDGGPGSGRSAAS